MCFGITIEVLLAKQFVVLFLRLHILTCLVITSLQWGSDRPREGQHAQRSRGGFMFGERRLEE